MDRRFVYLDYAATAPLVPEVLEACDGFLAAGAEGLFANANAKTCKVIFIFRIKSWHLSCFTTYKRSI